MCHSVCALSKFHKFHHRFVAKNSITMVTNNPIAKVTNNSIAKDDSNFIKKSWHYFNYLDKD